MPEIPTGAERFALVDLVKDLHSLMEKTAGAEPEPRSGSDVGRVVRTYYIEGSHQNKVSAYSIDLALLSDESEEILTVFPDETELIQFIDDIPPFFRPHNLDKTIPAVISKKTGPGLEEIYRTPTYNELLQVKGLILKYPDNLVDRL